MEIKIGKQVWLVRENNSKVEKFRFKSLVSTFSRKRTVPLKFLLDFLLAIFDELTIDSKLVRSRGVQDPNRPVDLNRIEAVWMGLDRLLRPEINYGQVRLTPQVTRSDPNFIYLKKYVPYVKSNPLFFHNYLIYIYQLS